MTERAGPRGADATTGKGVGARLRRKEDARFLRGRGEFVGNIRMVGHARRRFRALAGRARAHPQRCASPRATSDAVFTIDDLAGVRPIVADLGAQGLQASDAVAVSRKDKVRHVGEPVAMCVGADARRGRGHRGAGRGRLRGAARRRRHGRRAIKPRAPLVHEEWGDNVLLETLVDDELDEIRASRRDQRAAAHPHRAAVRCRRSKGAACVCELERAARTSSTMHSAAQMPHINRAGLSECLGIDQGRDPRRSRRTSAAASATRGSCSPRRSASPGSR